MKKNKIVNLDELETIIAEFKKNGKVVVHAHGCFDLLHIGHIKYFEACKKKGDILVVTVTPDKFVNKGPGRPAFNQDLRMTFLKNIEIIDFVCLNNEPDAINLLKKLKPDFTMRGKEYIDESNDLTGKISLERKAIESIGGKIGFVDDITFSSTRILNDKMDFLEEEVKNYINKIKKLSIPQGATQALEQIKEGKILLISDIIIDEYVYTSVLGTVTKHPAISASFLHKKVMGGGGIALAKNIANLSKKVSFHSAIGDLNLEYKHFIDGCLNSSSIENNCIVNEGDYTPVKTRFISSSGYPNPISGSIGDSSQDTSMRLFEIGYLPKSIDNHFENTFLENILSDIDNYDIAIISNFGHGLISKNIYNKVREKSKFLALNVQTNSSNFGFNLVTDYPNPDFVCIDELETRLALSNKNDDIDDVAIQLMGKIKCDKLMVTRGKGGINYYTNNGSKKYSSPALAREIVDPVGAGDAVFAGAALAAHIEADPNVTLLIGSVMGMLATQIVGNEKNVEMHELKQNIMGIL